MDRLEEQYLNAKARRDEYRSRTDLAGQIQYAKAMRDSYEKAYAVVYAGNGEYTTQPLSHAKRCGYLPVVIAEADGTMSED